MKPHMWTGPLEVKTPSVKMLVTGATTIFLTTAVVAFALLHRLVFPPIPGPAAALAAPFSYNSAEIVSQEVSPTPQPTLIPTATPTPTPAYYAPTRIIIPKLGVDTAIENVGITSDGAMDTPQNFDQVGWFSLGVKPGEMGSSVFAGHLDTQTGAPAVFYYLSQMTEGDEFQIVDETGRTLTFRVYQTGSYSENAFPLTDVFEKADGRYVNLITCHGIWQYGSHTYSDRFVVSAVLVE